ncbi:MAG: hypothetical protein ABIF89_02865 [bacterium]
MRKKTPGVLIILLIILGGWFFIRFVLGGDEDTWICQNGQWVKHGNPSSQKPAGECR